MKFFPVILCLFLFLTGCNKGTQFTVPQQSKVSKITAQIYGFPSGGNIPLFEVPQSSFKAILDILSKATEDNNAMKWMVLGDINIVHSTGTTKVMLFSTGEKIGAFKSNDIYYRGGSDQDFIKLITTAKQQTLKPIKAANKAQ